MVSRRSVRPDIPATGNTGNPDPIVQSQQKDQEKQGQSKLRQRLKCGSCLNPVAIPQTGGKIVSFKAPPQDVQKLWSARELADERHFRPRSSGLPDLRSAAKTAP